MGALMALDGGSWLQAFLGREPRPPPLDAKILGTLGAWALPYQKAISACF